MTKKEKMYQAISKHGADLNYIFKTDLDDITLSKKLFSLENKAHKLATDYCNGDIQTDNWDNLVEPILKRVRTILNTTDTYPIFVNGDCRGYALKIKDDYVKKTNMKIYQDWGGYGILAPDFN